MISRILDLILLPDAFAVCRLAPASAIPAWASASSFLSVTQTKDELSLVCSQCLVPEGIRCEAGWRCLRVSGTMDSSQVGILASLVGPLAEAGISVFAIPTFDTDYLLVKQTDLDKATAALRQTGHSIQ